jgi:glycosyltransferase involved in cell wall biosynthesis
MEKGRHSMGRVVRRLEVLAWQRFEAEVTREVDAVVVFTQRDRSALEPFMSDARLVTIPLAIDLPPQPVDPLGKNPDSLLFFGSFRHEPNVDAATRLARDIFPRIRSQLPKATLYIIGSDTTPVVERLAGDGIVVLGEVPDLTPHLDRAGLVLVPLRFGGGMRVKVLEALAAGKAVVASPLAVEGLDVIAGEHVVVAETDQEFAAAATELLANPSRRAAMGSHARAWAEANLSWDARIAAYEALYASLLEAAQPVTLGTAATA